MRQNHARHRTKEVLARDLVTVLALDLSHGTKYAVLDDALWKWSEYHGKHEGCACWSVEALKADGDKKGLRHEHLIPRTVLIAMLLNEPPMDAESLIAWLDRRCIGVVVTVPEDKWLNEAGLRSKMPAGWDGQDIWARYRAAGIRLAAGLGGGGRVQNTALARDLLGDADARLMAFLRATDHHGGVKACQFINKELNEGKTLEAILSEPGDEGYSLEATGMGDGRWVIKFGCQVGPCAGDGGEWEVQFGETGEVIECNLTSSWIS